jgi:YD repeat-containing protein
LQPLGTIDPNNPPIAGQNGIPSSEGLTTTFRYDDNLGDALGLSNPSDPNSVAPYLTGLNFGTNAAGRALVAINPVGEPTWTIYDGTGRIVRVIDGNGNATTTTYDVVDANGLLDTTVTDALGHSTSIAQDSAGWTRTSTDQLGQSTTHSFDANGDIISVRDPNAVGQDCLYDSRNRRIQCTDTTSVVTLTGYDFNSNVVSTTDGLGHMTTMAFDARDRKVSSTDSLSGLTQFAYDPTSNLQTITDAQGGITTYTFDARNLILSETYPPGMATPGSPTTPPLDQRVYTYDAARRLTTRTDQVALLTSYVYDMASRLTGRLYGDGMADSFGYDPASRLINATSSHYGTAVTRSYTGGGEKAGRLTSETQTVNGVTNSLTYTYDAANRQTGVTYPDGTPVARAFTNRNQMSSVAYGGNAIASAITYDNGMRRTSTALGNSLTESRTYRADNLLASIQVPGVTSYTYSYDSDKNVTLEANGLYAAENESYAFDTENRVTGWQRDGIESQIWTLSLVGDWNSTARTGPNAFSQTRTHSSVHETTGITPGTGSPQSLGYDTKGNLTSIIPTQAVFQINAGGGAAGSYIADTDFTGGASASTSNAISVTGVANPAPQAVYQSERYANGAGSFSYTLPGLTAGATYTVRLHFAEFYWTTVGQRIFNVTINGAPVLNDFDIIAAAGAPLTAIAKSFTTTATSGGTIVIGFSTVVDNAKISGIEVLAGSAPTYTWDEENRLATASQNGVTTGYVYDALGRRLGKTSASGTTTFVHDGAQNIAEYQASGFQNQDIGGPSIAGSFAVSGPGTYTITGSGVDIWNSADQFQFAYQTLAGDGSITAYVASQTASDPWAKAGVMVRESLAAGSTHAFMAVSPGNGEAFQSRQTTGGSSINTNTGSTPAPYWVRVIRAGSTFTGYSSPDGVTWTKIGSDSITMASPAYIGLAVCSHTNSATSTVVFSNVSTTGVIASLTAPVLANRYVYSTYVDEPLAIISDSGGPTNTNYLHSNRVYSVAAMTNNSGTVVERYRYASFGASSGSSGAPAASDFDSGTELASGASSAFLEAYAAS